MWRFQLTSLDGHGAAAVARFQEALSLPDLGHSIRPAALAGLATVLHHRFTHDKRPQVLEEAISHSRAALASLPPEHPMRPVCLSLLANSLKVRFATDSLEGIVQETAAQQARLANLPLSHSSQLDILHSLGHLFKARFRHTTDLADLDKAIQYHTMALAASPPGHYARRLSLFSLGKTSQELFLRTGHAPYLTESIEHCREALKMCPPGQVSRFEPLHTLAISLSLRTAEQHQRADFEEAMTLFRSAFNEVSAGARERLTTAYHWATFGRLAHHPSTLPAYQSAVTLLHEALAVAPQLEVQQRVLRGTWGARAALPLEAASYQIEFGMLAREKYQVEPGMLQRAVETLERGRALLWTEMRGFRPSLHALRAAKPALAARLIAVDREREGIATSAEAGSPAQPQQGDYHTTDAFSQVMGRAHVLEREREQVLSEIRAVTGFRDFLRAVPFNTLQTAASGGPVIIINHCRFRCDIIIVLSDAPPVLIPTAEDFYARANGMKEKLLETRAKYALESKQYQRALRSVLEDLHEFVGQPVIDKLRDLAIPEQSRVWWCPTSVFCSLPLHAAGPVSSDNGMKQYFSDIYISSYTPTLSALIEARERSARASGPPSLLIVGQPDITLPGVRGEIKVVRGIATSGTSLVGRDATRATVMDHLPKHTLAHFACHGSLELEKPFDASFVLYDDEGLTLLDVVKSKHPEAELAFLSACHTAEWTDEHAPDEALHLTAAMHYCGFRSVVGTLWALADTDGRDISKHFYQQLFAEAEGGFPIGEGSARALRDATQKLRGKRGVALERWVNFVHYGV
ncbi:CHAT domain-containing protein [Gloeopeniophorella convolvens]|nr:CHAT domain-containing protein [Gloeopeniophorella convolvens]